MILNSKILCYILFLAKLMQNHKINIQMNSLNLKFSLNLI